MGDGITTYSQEYYQEHREAILANTAVYREAHREQERERVHRWRLEHLDEQREKNRQRASIRRAKERQERTLRHVGRGRVVDENGEPMRRGHIGFQCDDADFEHLRQFAWYPFSPSPGKVYLARQTTGQDKWAGNKAFIAMHVDLMRPTPGMVVHHLNGDGCDNRRENLQVLTISEHSRLSMAETRAKGRIR